MFAESRKAWIEQGQFVHRIALKWTREDSCWILLILRLKRLKRQHYTKYYFMILEDFFTLHKSQHSSKPSVSLEKCWPVNRHFRTVYRVIKNKLAPFYLHILHQMSRATHRYVAVDQDLSIKYCFCALFNSNNLPQLANGKGEKMPWIYKGDRRKRYFNIVFAFAYNIW